jgi:hypothetical protein
MRGRGVARALRSAAVVACLGCNGEFRFDDVTDAGADAASGGPGAPSEEAGASATCTSDSECTRYGLHCDVFAGRCTACDDDAHCAAPRPRCYTSIHRCVECLAASDCGDAGICDLHTRRCVQSCNELVPSSCPGGWECDDSRCRQCESDERCRSLTATPHCDPGYGRCVACALDTQCAAPTARCDRTLGKCVQCISSDQCPATTPLCDSTGICIALMP